MCGYAGLQVCRSCCLAYTSTFCLPPPPIHAGAALGTGSALAHRAVDAVMGGRGGSEAPAAAPAAPEVYAAPPAAQQSAEEKCAAQSKAFAECMSRNNADLGACQFYFESMQVWFVCLFVVLVGFWGGGGVV
jgi:hypothetical protein